MLPHFYTDGGSIFSALAEKFFPERAKQLCKAVFTACGAITAAALFAAVAVYENPYLLIGAFYAVICLIKY